MRPDRPEGDRFLFRVREDSLPRSYRDRDWEALPDLLRVDKLYRTKYGMSPVANLEFLKEKGMAAFLRQQRKEHACPECGGIVCVHDGKCYACGRGG